MIGLGRVPLEALVGVQSSWADTSSLNFDMKQIQNAMLLSWMFWGIFHGIWSFFLKSRRQSLRSNASHRSLWRPILNLVDMMAVIAVQSTLLSQSTPIWFVCALITVKSVLQSHRKSSPKLLRMLVIGI